MQIGTPFIATATVAAHAHGAITIACGFRPGVVYVINKTNGHVGMWVDGMTAGHLIVLTTGSADLRTTLGVTVTENVAGAVDGFTIGDELVDFNDTEGEVLIFVVLPNGMKT